MFQSVVINEENNEFKLSIVEKDLKDLPNHDVLIKVLYSSLNYKDALSVTGNKGVTKKYPHTPGIDAVGYIESDLSNTFKKGDLVVVTGFDLGMNTSGGLEEYIKVPKEWIVLLDSDTIPLEVISYGTAGFTAALGIKEIIDFKIKPQDGKILITGITGGVGSLSALILSHLGYDVVGISRKKQTEETFIKSLGVKEVIDYNEFIKEEGDKPLLKPKYIAAIDTIGSSLINTILKQLDYRGILTTCGMVSGINFSTNVFPFILRGVRLIGIDSVLYPIEKRKELWHLMLTEWKPKNLEKLVRIHKLTDIENDVKNIIEGKNIGRIVIKL